LRIDWRDRTGVGRNCPGPAHRGGCRRAHRHCSSRDSTRCEHIERAKRPSRRVRQPAPGSNGWRQLQLVPARAPPGWGLRPRRRRKRAFL